MLNAVVAFQVFFIKCLFIFFVTLFLKMMRMLSTSNPGCHGRLYKRIFKILPIQRYILRKELFQALSCFKYGFTLFHTSKFQIFATKSNVMVKVAWYLPQSKVLFLFLEVLGECD